MSISESSVHGLISRRARQERSNDLPAAGRKEKPGTFGRRRARRYDIVEEHDGLSPEIRYGRGQHFEVPPDVSEPFRQRKGRLLPLLPNEPESPDFGHSRTFPKFSEKRSGTRVSPRKIRNPRRRRKRGDGVRISAQDRFGECRNAGNESSEPFPLPVEFIRPEFPGEPLRIRVSYERGRKGEIGKFLPVRGNEVALEDRNGRFREEKHLPEDSEKFERDGTECSEHVPGIPGAASENKEKPMKKT